MGDETSVIDVGFLDTQLITLTSKRPNLKTQLPCPHELNHEQYDYKIGLKKFQTYYAFPNITESVNNQLSIRPGKDKSFLLVKLPTGAYEIDTINSSIYSQLKKNHIKNPEKFFILSPDTTTFKTIISLSENWAVNFNVNHSIAYNLGFDKSTILDTNGEHYSTHTAQIQTFNSLLFLTNISILQSILRC